MLQHSQSRYPDDDGESHCCVDYVASFLKIHPDLEDTPLDDATHNIFVDGSSYTEDFKEPDLLL